MVLRYSYSMHYGRVRDRIFTANKTNRIHHYPREICDEVQKIPQWNNLSVDWLHQLPSTGWSPGNGLNLESWTIPLATYSIPFEDLDWNKKENDQEDTFALHRFIWLLRWLSLHPSENDLQIADSVILNWIDQIKAREMPIAWETYSVSERIVNWLLYLCATKQYRALELKTTQVIAASLLEHLNHIVWHLEYRDQHFNNHILNNARALYIGGSLLQLSQFAKLGQELFKHHVPQMINETGELLEGSSHYQLLLTRTFVEVLWAAYVTADLEFVKYLEPVVQAMANCCLYLNVESMELLDNSFPRIGDVSPDCPILWFYPIPPHDQKGENWWGLWNSDELQSLFKIAPDECKEFPTQWRWITNADSGFRAFAPIPRHQGYPDSHGHLDFGSFLLYDRETPLLVDRGRSSYTRDSLSLYGKSAEAHNTTTINNLPILPFCQGVFGAYKEYLTDGTQFNNYNSETETFFSWRTNAVNRLGTGLNWRRKFILTSQYAESLETLENPRGLYLKVQSYIHWAPGWRIYSSTCNSDSDYYLIMERSGKKYCLRIKGSTLDYVIDCFEGNTSDLYGWHFPEYGSQIPALTLRFFCETSQDYIFKFSLCRI